MNLRQPYEQLIARKLRQLPAPDADASWQQMKQLLDDEQDRGAGGKRPPGNNGWWRIGLLAVVLSASFWLYTGQQHPTSAPLASGTTAAPAATQTNNSTTSNTKATKNNSIDNTTTLNASASNVNNIPADQPASTGNDKEAVSDAASPAAALKATGNGSSGTIAPKDNTGAAKDNDKTALNSAIASHQTNGSNRTEAAKLNAGQPTVKHNRKHNSGNKSSINDGWIQPEPTYSTAYRIPKTGKPLTGAVSNAGDQGDAGSNEPETSADNTSSLANSLGFTTRNGSRQTAVNNAEDRQAKAWLQQVTGLPLTDAAAGINTLRAADSLGTSTDVSRLLSNDTRKAIAKANRDQAIALLDKKDKKFHLDLSNAFKPFSMRADNDPWWAAGIAINGAATVGAQNRFNYNMNAKSGTLTDYIPSPYLQYHVNDYVYFQTELNFVAPQYTPQLLLLRSLNDITTAGSTGAAMSQQKMVYVQKMYYFNWPVSLHYSPVKNLFFSGGIQFSSFQSGLATVEDRKYETSLGPDHASSINTTVLKFKDDSIAAKIAPNEWRWQLGAEYYINRFSIGLKYNQSFKKAINTTVAGSSTPTVYRNEALLFSIRYNLFESRNKKESSDKN